MTIKVRPEEPKFTLALTRAEALDLYVHMELTGDQATEGVQPTLNDVHKALKSFLLTRPTAPPPAAQGS